MLLVFAAQLTLPHHDNICEGNFIIKSEQHVCVHIRINAHTLGLSKLLKNDVRIFALKKHIYSNIFEFLVAH